MRRLEDKVAMVSGASGHGIGRETAVAFAEAGAAVAINDHRNTEGADETAALIRDAGGDALVLPGDFADPDSIMSFVAGVVDHFGRLDVAFNNAGVVGDHGDIVECSLANWQRIIALNLTGVFVAMKAQIPHMLDAGGGAIVNDASIAGLRASPHVPAYGASKHGVLSLTRSTAWDFGQRGIRINAVCPAAIKSAGYDEFGEAYGAGFDEFVSQSIALGHIGEPADVAALVVFLCSDDAKYITGQAIPVDGGWTAR